MKKNNYNKFKKQKGLGLIEVLIALAIISVGLLGLATLNATTYRQARSAELRQTAMFLTEDIRNRISMNYLEARKGSASIYNDSSQANGVNNLSCSQASRCNSVEMAQLDLYQVYDLVKTLPVGKLTVCLSSVTGSCDNQLNGGLAGFSITVNWNNGNVVEKLSQYVIP